VHILSLFTLHSTTTPTSEGELPFGSRTADNIEAPHHSSPATPATAFDPFEYSKFKYGSTEIAKRYGVALAEKFITVYGEQMIASNSSSTNLMISTSAFKYCPSASASVTNYFQDHVNWWLYKKGKKPMNKNQIFRCETTEGDYGKLSSDQRQVLMMQNNYSVDMNRLRGGTFLVLDDIRITGAHEQKVQHFLRDSGVETLFLLYVAMFETPPLNPGVESMVNDCWIKGRLSCVASIINSGHFTLNARVCKFLLSYKDLTELRLFFLQCPQKLIYDVFVSTVGDGYCFMKEYGILETATYRYIVHHPTHI